MGRMGGNSRTYSANPGDYKLLEEVGYGASATVYRAIYLPFNEVVAVKCLDLDRCNSNFVSFLIYLLFLLRLAWSVEIWISEFDRYVHRLRLAFD